MTLATRNVSGEADYTLRLDFRSALWADCKHIPMDLCHQKQPPQKVYQPAQILPSNFQLRQLDQKHVSKPGQTSYLLVRRPGKPSPPTPSSFLDFLFVLIMRETVWNP